MTDKMSSPRRRMLPILTAAALVALGGAAGIGYVQAQSSGAAPTTPPAAATVSPDKVVATVNGQKITEGDLVVAQRDLSEEIAPGADGGQRQALIDAVVNLTLIAQAAEQGKLADADDFKRRMALLRQRVLRSEYVRANISSAATDAVLKKRYDEEIGKLDAPEEVKASHILVATEDEAKAVVEELKKGGDFAAIAKAKSKDTGSAQNGGDLGYFSRGQMVKAFEDAAFSLAPGKYTETPVKSEFGFHIIKVEDKRKQPPPAFDEVKEQLQQLVMAELYREQLKKLRDGAKIEMTDPAPTTAPAPAK